MDLKTAFERNLPLKIILSKNRARVIAEGFVVKGGVFFWDIGWYESSSHPNHLVEGKISGEGPWKVGDKVIKELTEEEPLYVRDWMIWMTFRRTTEEGKQANRDLARDYTEEEFEIL
jgi:hypothetical protein